MAWRQVRCPCAPPCVSGEARRNSGTVAQRSKSECPLEERPDTQSSRDRWADHSVRPTRHRVAVRDVECALLGQVSHPDRSAGALAASAGGPLIQYTSLALCRLRDASRRPKAFSLSQSAPCVYPFLPALRLSRMTPSPEARLCPGGPALNVRSSADEPARRLASCVHRCRIVPAPFRSAPYIPRPSFRLRGGDPNSQPSSLFRLVFP